MPKQLISICNKLISEGPQVDIHRTGPHTCTTVNTSARLVEYSAEVIGDNIMQSGTGTRPVRTSFIGKADSAITVRAGTAAGVAKYALRKFAAELLPSLSR